MDFLLEEEALWSEPTHIEQFRTATRRKIKLAVVPRKVPVVSSEFEVERCVKALRKLGALLAGRKVHRNLRPRCPMTFQLVARRGPLRPRTARNCGQKRHSQVRKNLLGF